MGLLLSSRPMLKPFSGEKIVPSKWGPKMAVLWENGGPDFRYWFRDPQKALPCAEPRRLTFFCVKIGARVSAVAFLKNPKIAESLCVTRGAKSRMRRTETTKPIWIKFCVAVDIADIVTYTNFGDRRLRGFWVASHRLTSSPLQLSDYRASV